jgi:Uma2 family endonuclease
MASTASTTTPPNEALPPLEPGDRLDQPTFHQRYEAMPKQTRAELIGGIVYMPSPLKRPHGQVHAKVVGWLSAYEDATPGTQALDNATTILGPESEPQPDASLLIVPEKGGQIRDEGGYVAGAPELIVEVASSTEAIDLHLKRRDYETAGVKEYVVVVLRQKRVLWLARPKGSFEELAPGADGILRSEVFPGLWLDPGALLRCDGQRVREVLEKGLAAPEHAAFVAKLAAHTP